LPTVTHSPNHRQAGTPMINSLPTLRIFSGCYKIISFAISFGRKGNSYTISMHLDLRVRLCVCMCVCVCVCVYVCVHKHTHTHIFHNIETLIGQKKFKKRAISKCRLP